MVDVVDLTFPLSVPLEIWGVDDTIFVDSCEQGESVTGFNYDFVSWDYNAGDTYGGDDIFGEYVITSIGLECSASGENFVLATTAAPSPRQNEEDMIVSGLLRRSPCGTD